MTWEERLFSLLDDLEARADSAFSLERDLEIADRARGEYATVTLAGRLMASAGSDIACEVLGVGRLSGRLARVANGWLLLEDGSREWLVRTAALVSTRGLSRRSLPQEAWPVAARLGFGSAMRRLVEDRAECRIWSIDGTSHDVRPIRVGADFVEAASGTGDELLLAFGSLAAVTGQVASGS